MCCHKKKSRILNSGEGACSATKCYMPPVERHWTTGKQRDGTPKLHGVYTSGFSYPASIAAPLWEVRFRTWPHRMVLLRRRRPALTLSLLSISVQKSLYRAVLLLRIRLYSRLIRFGVISSLLSPLCGAVSSVDLIAVSLFPLGRSILQRRLRNKTTSVNPIFSPLSVEYALNRFK